MRYTLTHLSLALASLVLPFTASSQTAPHAAQRTGFTENKGQVAFSDGTPADNVLFRLSGGQQGLFVTTQGLTHVFTKTTKPAEADDENRARTVQWSKLEMELQGAVIKKENIETSEMLTGYSNYYYAHCPQGVLDVRSWHKVTIHDVYPGIDWVLYADEKGMAHDFIVHPGADASMIKLVYKGANELLKQGQSKLKISSAYGTLYEGDLKSYTAEGIPVNSKFRVKNNMVSFIVGKYKSTETLTIDPPLQWSAQQISTGFDYAYAVSAPRDGTGEACVTGFTDASDFPVLNAYQGTIAANEDMFIQRLSSSGALVWSTYYGGSDYEAGKGITTDNTGNCYIAGYTGSSDFPLQNPVQSIYGGGVYDAAILKFNNAGARQWATFYGGLSTDYANAIDADAAANIYITGYTNSTAFPTLNPVQASKSITYDAFMMKMSTLSTVQWATYYGGDDEDKGRGIAVDQAGANVYITGSTIAGTFPTTPGVLQQFNGSGYYAEDAFITKMSTLNGTVQFSTFFGGNDADFGQGIAVDAAGNAFITGYTFSPDMSITNPGGNAYVDSSLGSPGMHDAFVMECNSTGTTRLWSTYMGGTSSDLGFAITWDANAGIYITGRTSSTDFPVMMPADNVFYQPVHGDGGNYNDMFITWFNNSVMQWSTFFGGAESEEGYGISTDVGGYIYVAGHDSDDVQVLKFAPGELITGISSITQDNISVYPDPVTEVLNADIAVTGEQAVRARIITMQGQEVKAMLVPVMNGSNHIKLFTSDIAAGVYLLEIKSDQGIMQKKFVKK